MNTFKILLLSFGLLAAAGASAQKKELDNGFWELITTPGQKHTTIVCFYNLQSQLIYEEKVVGVKFNLNRKKTRQRLIESLDKALLTYNEKQTAIKNEDWVAVTFK